MSCLRQYNVNIHMCHMRMSLKALTHFNTIRNVWVITPHDATQQFGMRRLPPHRLHSYAPTPPPDETLTLPPHLRPHHSLHFHTPAAYHLYAPAVPSPLLTLLHPRLIFSSAYNPYTPVGPSSYASDTALTPPYASLHLPNPMRCLPSLCSWSAFLTCLKCHLPSLRLWSAFPPCLRHRLPSLRSFSAILTCL
ncbi:hypothetical protein O181_117759 [Austropuccinia psidii MF-1]|uniref:Uncharacterized protein n=1 Tax=Austropuccinia psidii MF-1 TaxID=1389203 RepID=A0A9Q3PXT7_9BASI|nr:hypothetical protein [Austropuccinia psidii MF-1]